VSAPFGYIDPGTGSMLLQVIIGGVAAAAVGFKLFWSRILDILHIRPREKQKPAPRAE
jgi:hypothetical protein